MNGRLICKEFRIVFAYTFGSQKYLPPRVESPTTAQPLEFDDDANENTANAESRNRAPDMNTALVETVPPAQPSRPKSPFSQAEVTLIEAFPGLDAKVVKAVLVASGGKLEPAFNALLSQYNVNILLGYSMNLLP